MSGIAQEWDLGDLGVLTLLCVCCVTFSMLNSLSELSTPTITWGLNTAHVLSPLKHSAYRFSLLFLY